MKCVIKGILFSGFLVSTMIASDRELGSSDEAGESAAAFEGHRGDSSGHRRRASSRALSPNLVHGDETVAAGDSLQKGAATILEGDRELDNSEDEAGRGSCSSGLGDTGMDEKSDEDSDGSPKLHRSGLFAVSSSAMRGSLSPRSMRQEVTNYAQRFATASTDGLLDSGDEQDSAEDALVALVAQCIASSDDARLLAMQAEVQACIDAGTCDIAFMQRKSEELLMIMTPAPSALDTGHNQRTSDSEGSGSSSEDEDEEIDVPTLLAQLRELKPEENSQLLIDGFRSKVRELIEDNWDIFAVAQYLPLRTIVYAEDASITLAPEFKMQLVTALIEVCQVIEAARNADVSAGAQASDSVGQPVHAKKRSLCNPGCGLVSAVLVAAVAIFVRAMLESRGISL